MLKLLCIVCFLALAVLAAYAADRHELGWRAEVLLTLCVILPQGFLAAGCAAQIEVLSALLLGISLTLLDEKKHPLAAMLLYGAAAAVSGAALYAIPLVCWLSGRDSVKPVHIAAGCAVVLLACVPAIIGGMPAGKAFASLLNVPFALPEYAAGVPNFASVFPRAAMEEMPEYFMLRQVPMLDSLTNASEFYTQTHFVELSHGMAFGALAAYIYCSNALMKADRAAATEIWNSVDPGIRADAQAANEHYAQYEGKVQDAATKVNDAYLKAFSEETGVQSYGEVADLLIAWYQQKAPRT